MDKVLVLYEDYTREDVHDIFDPESSFISQRGTWGMHGIVRIPSRSNDYIFFVSFGQSQSGHKFIETVTEDGIITWQSQPSQRLTDLEIKQFIDHDHRVNNIYLFLRTSKMHLKKARKYTYLGKLAFLNFDHTREKPVYFTWQILDWNLPLEVAKRMALNLQTVNEPQINIENSRDCLCYTDIPINSGKKSGPSSLFGALQIDHAEVNKSNKQTGDAGENLVYEMEREYLTGNGRPDLAEKIVHTAAIEGDGTGYDIRSFNLDGTIKYIEVKTTTGGSKTPFYLTINELLFSKINKSQYCLYRVYEYNHHLNTGKYYILRGDISKATRLEPIEYKAYI